MHDVLSHDTVAAAHGLAPHIRAVRDELEAMRRIPPALASFNSISPVPWAGRSWRR